MARDWLTSPVDIGRRSRDTCPMRDPVTVAVLVPADRTRDFDTALGALVSGDQPPAPEGGSSGKSWQEVSVVLTTESVASFYAAFGEWVKLATKQAAPLAAFDASHLKTLWNTLPQRELKLLSLCSDNFGRSVGWPEVKRKLGLAGKPSLTRDLPQLAQFCKHSKIAFPVLQDGEGDDAVFSLTEALVNCVQLLRRTGPLSATA